MSPDNTNVTTRDRLLKVAEKLFAQKGYDAVSVREITTTANCNLAAVNYHFGTKQSLYLQMFRERWLSMAQRILDCFEENLAGYGGDSSPDTIIRSLAEAFIKGPLTDEERLYHFQLMTRELIKPTEGFDLVVNEVVRLFFERLGQRLSVIFADTTDAECMILNILSIIAMINYFTVARTPVSKIIGRTYDESFKNRLVQHIVTFCLSGLPLKEAEQ